jgi:cytochrome c oxidase assembly protein subunit 15
VPARIETLDGRAALHRFAIVCASATFILIFAGGLVTSTGSALAVPDWPLAFGKWIPPLSGGIRFEWSHRVMAGAVSLLTLALAIWTGFVEERRWVRLTAFAALGLIVLQALLGGLTVLLLLPLPLAVAHAAAAQAFFGLMIAMVLFTSPWFGASQHLGWEGRSDRRLVVLATVTTAAIYVQILIGALMRHLGAGLAIPDFPTSFGHLVPPFYSLAIDVNFAHRCGAAVMTLLVVLTAAEVMRLHSVQSPLGTWGILMLVLLAAQLSLGALTIWTGRAVLSTTAHVAIGAAVLGASLAVTIRVYELRAAAVTGAPGLAAPVVSAIEHKVPA